MNGFTLLFILALTLTTGFQLWLARRHGRHVAAHRERIPPAFAGRVSIEAHRKAADYTVAKMRFGGFEQLAGAAILLFWTLGGGIAWLDALWRSFGLGPVATGTGFLVTLFLVGSLIELPLTALRVFGVEQRFGFNRVTPALFFADAARQGLLMILLGIPLAALVLWLMAGAGTLWWLYVWLVWTGFAMLMLWAFPAFIAPLFNKFTPLADRALEERIRRLLERCGFQSKGIFVMDGSRRSSHGNAYFTGLGNSKRIVFFDTLLAQLAPEEIEAVLAHELGHFRRRHVRRRFLLMAGATLAGLALLGWIIDRPWFYSGLGVATPSLWGAVALFLLVSPVFTYFLQPWIAAMMRRQEFEADDFAAEQSDPRHLIQALVKLYRENATTLTPDPLYSAFHDSHPPAPLRVAHLSAKIR